MIFRRGWVLLMFSWFGVFVIAQALTCYNCNTGRIPDEACARQPVLSLNTTVSSPDCTNDGWAFFKELNATIYEYNQRIIAAGGATPRTFDQLNAAMQSFAKSRTSASVEAQSKKQFCFTLLYAGYNLCTKGQPCPQATSQTHNTEGMVHRGCVLEAEENIRTISKLAFDIDMRPDVPLAAQQCGLKHYCFVPVKGKLQQVGQSKVCFCDSDACNIQINYLDNFSDKMCPSQSGGRLFPNWIILTVFFHALLPLSQIKPIHA